MEKKRNGESGTRNPLVRRSYCEGGEPGTLNLADQYHFHSTFDIIRAAEAGELPDQIMMTFHPQRWTDKPVPWIKELVMQNIKNQIKKYFIIR